MNGVPASSTMPVEDHVAQREREEHPDEIPRERPHLDMNGLQHDQTTDQHGAAEPPRSGFPTAMGVVHVHAGGEPTDEHRNCHTRLQEHSPRALLTDASLPETAAVREHDPRLCLRVRQSYGLEHFSASTVGILVTFFIAGCSALLVIIFDRSLRRFFGPSSMKIMVVHGALASAILLLVVWPTAHGDTTSPLWVSMLAGGFTAMTLFAAWARMSAALGGKRALPPRSRPQEFRG